MSEKEIEKTNQLECVENEKVLDSTQLLDKLDNVQTNQDIKDLTTLFNVSIAKNEMIRALKQDELLNIVLEQAAERLKKRPDELSTKDLLDYMNAFQNNIDRVGGVVEKVNTTPTIQINQHKDVVINVGDLSRNSKENVMDAIKELLQNAENMQDVVDIIDVSDEETKND